MILGRSTPDPGIGTPVELSGSDPSGLLNLVGVGKTLARQGIATEETPPAFLQVEPTRPSGNADLMEPGMLERASRIIGFDVSEQCNAMEFVELR